SSKAATPGRSGSSSPGIVGQVKYVVRDTCRSELRISPTMASGGVSRPTAFSKGGGDGAGSGCALVQPPKRTTIGRGKAQRKRGRFIAAALRLLWDAMTTELTKEAGDRV